MTESSHPWLTVVTVVKDDPEGFARTAASVRREALDGVEWVVVDSSANRVEAADATYRWTEPAGIYPAMNAGLCDATGDYVYFLNAGDEFADAGVLARVRLALETKPTWLVGEVAFVYPDGSVVTPGPINYQAERRALFSRGRFPPHQGTIASRAALLDLGGFSLDYDIAADYEAMLKLAKRADPITTDIVLARFLTGGTSSVHWRRSIKEFHRARRTVFRPTDLEAVKEHVRTLTQFARMSAVRLLKPAHR